MMGDFSGYAGFLSAWFDPLLGEEGEWVIQFSSCGVGVQHWWWVVHIVDFALLVAMVGGGVAWVVESFGAQDGGAADVRGKSDEHAIEKTQGEKGGVVKENKTVVRMPVEPGAKSLGETRRV
jgi:hypothetical protein